MELKAAHLADAANISQEGKLNIHGIFSRIGLSSFPGTYSKFTVVVILEAHPSETGKHTLNMRLADEDGREVAKVEGEIEVGKAKLPDRPIRVQVVLPMEGLRFPKPGNYSFDILLDGRYEDSIPLEIVARGEED